MGTSRMFPLYRPSVTGSTR